MHVVLGEHRSCCPKDLLKGLDCHIVLGRGHTFFEKLGVRTVVTSKQSTHLLLPLTRFGPQGNKIPAEIQPRISSDECVIYRATCDSSRQEKIHLWMASASNAEHQKLIAPTLNLSMERMDKRITLVTKRETTGKTDRDDG